MPTTMGLEGPPPSCSTCRPGVDGVDQRWLGPNLSTRRSRKMPQFFGLRGLFGLGTPANDLAKQLPSLIAGNEWEVISSLLIGLSQEELQAVSDRAIALHDVNPVTMKAIIDTLGKTEVIEVVDSKPAAALNMLKNKSAPLWLWILGAVALVGTGIFIIKRKKAI